MELTISCLWLVVIYCTLYGTGVRHCAYGAARRACVCVCVVTAVRGIQTARPERASLSPRFGTGVCCVSSRLALHYTARVDSSPRSFFVFGLCLDPKLGSEVFSPNGRSVVFAGVRRCLPPVYWVLYSMAASVGAGYSAVFSGGSI
jgi:hypothetical protein